MSPPKIGGYIPYGPDERREHDAYVERVTQECMTRKAEVERVISPEASKLGIKEDIVAEAIERTVDYAARYGVAKEIESVLAFLITTARRLLVSAYRKASAGEIDAVRLDDKATAPLLVHAIDWSAKQLLERLEREQTVKIALGNLSEADRKVFLMNVEHDMTPEEIAVTMKVSAAMVRVRLRRARAMMRAVMMRSNLA
jgi:RNA polymerase sigma factor (sigma-70 family)